MEPYRLWGIPGGRGHGDTHPLAIQREVNAQRGRAERVAQIDQWLSIHP
jgi:hypothetical protein